MRFKKLGLILAALVVSASLAACSSAGQSDQSSGNSQKEQPKEQAQKQPEDKKMTEEAKDRQVAPKAGTDKKAEQGGNKLEPAKDKTLRLTVPKMAEIKNDEIPTGKGTEEALFRDYAAVRLPYTGFPWQEEANIYIAGHRIGFPGTNSDLAFYDLEDLANGDEVYLEDSEGRQYTYEVFNKKIVEPTDLSVLKRIEGKNILTLQTCTLPDYTDRVIYQAELKDIKT
ncbi:sortase [Rubrobacter tropicus]|uniref:Sortase n=1 Tax=Rubrobacter tropicus TaxID=2653851 RepID=A0A6G8QC55_9ACTN|nr:class E sortase [Rubrobacter tropicus]QIN84023.1 sortase [Rubrobacter tropicus]